LLGRGLAPVLLSRIVSSPHQASRPVVVFPVSREQVLRLAVRSAARVPGNVIEFGVAQGASTRVLRNELRRLRRQQPKIGRRRLFACDSFRGLPEQFETLTQGTFACEPPRIRGVAFVVGYFDQTLDEALAQRVGRVALASLDADLESSTLCALRWLTPLLDPGSLLLFDEFDGDGGAERRAYETWTAETGVQTSKVAEFVRPTAGFGTERDRRVLVQVLERRFGRAGQYRMADTERQGRGVTAHTTFHQYEG
jgi:Methyltransferase domain